MPNVIVVNNPKSWPLHIPGVPTVAARSYLTDPEWGKTPGLKVFNLCKQYRYQSTGYYVSLLAMARGHKPVPSVTTIQDMKSLAIARVVADDLDDLIQSSLRSLKSEEFTLSIYFGRNMAKRYDELSSHLFRQFQAPLLRAEFARDEKNGWRLQNISPIAGNSIPEAHYPFVIEAARAFFAHNRLPARRRATTPYDLAILTNPAEALPPSNKTALRKFAASGRRQGFAVEFIERTDFGRLAEFDALFIRETTNVHHHTYRFARRAAAEGLVVIDDPDSIAKCTNKVYLAELLARHKIAVPRTMIVHDDNADEVARTIGLPCILKLPDSSFSQGVVKADDDAQLGAIIEGMLEKSDLIIAQEFMPTEFDWRIGVLDRQPLYACRYFMVPEHWQILKSDAGQTRVGAAHAVPLAGVPECVLKAAVRTARLIGDGLYGVDVKHDPTHRKAYLIEINDNPTIDGGIEDAVLGNELYDRIIGVLLARVQGRKAVPPGNGREHR